MEHSYLFLGQIAPVYNTEEQVGEVEVRNFQRLIGRISRRDTGFTRNPNLVTYYIRFHYAMLLQELGGHDSPHSLYVLSVKCYEFLRKNFLL